MMYSLGARPRSAVCLFVVSFLTTACGSSDSSPAASATGPGGTGGVAGSTGSAGGKAGTGGGATGGGAGASGKGGSTGATGGAGGSDGGAAGGTSCKLDMDCAPPSTIPAGCAVGKCDLTKHTCTFTAKDGDADGHPSSKCKSMDGTPIVLGDDCDDADPISFPGSWDGPKGAGKPDRCDGVDEDCNGTADDGKQADGTSCTCTPNDVRSCSTDAGGKPIAWPTGMPTGTCKYGTQTCLANGMYGPCIGAVAPTQESCNHLDDDCNGMVDDGAPPEGVPFDAVYWAYDGDDDLHARMPGSGYKAVKACPFNPPNDAPAACTMGLFTSCTLGKTAAECCPPSKWKTAASIPADDCNDEDGTASPTSPELCGNGIDDNCDNAIDEGCVCPPNGVAACSFEANGAPIPWPGGAPQGNCKYGTHQCAANGKAWGTCTGAITPAAVDGCLTAGDDANCNGIPNEGCGCFPDGATQSCGKSVGSCSVGIQTCVGGQWGSCSGVAPKPADTCLTGNDDNCNGVANEGCSCTTGATAACGTCNGGTKVCDGSGQYGACADPNTSHPLGTTCDIGAPAKGACVAGGQWGCQGAADTCIPVDANIGVDTFQSFPAPNGSFDWNCDGTETAYYTTANASFRYSSTSAAGVGMPYGDAISCYNPPDFDAICAQYGSASGCNGSMAGAKTNVVDCGYTLPLGAHYCGAVIYIVTCSWSGSACYSSNALAARMKCK